LDDVQATDTQRYTLIARQGPNLALALDNLTQDTVVLQKGAPGWNQLEGNTDSHDDANVTPIHATDSAALDHLDRLVNSLCDAPDQVSLPPELRTGARSLYESELAAAMAVGKADESSARSLLTTHRALLASFHVLLPVAKPSYMALNPQRGLLRYDLQHAGTKIEQDPGAEYHVALAIAQFMTMTQSQVGSG
jgi:hypothetical protein